MSDILSKAIVRLFDQERFYAELILQMDRIVSHKIPTAGVCIKDRVQLYVNPDFFASLSQDEQVAILKHECKHILNDHIPRSKDYAPDVYEKKPDADGIDRAVNSAKHMLINVACDLAINPGIKHLPEGAQMPNKFELIDGQLMEWYANQLKDNPKMKEFGDIYDEHSLWSESEGSQDELKAKLRKAVNAAAASTKASGCLSHEDELLVDRLNYKARDWKADLRRFAARATETLRRESKKRRNRRYGVMYPGSVKEELLHIGVAIDTSGSISDEALGQFMAEIAVIAKYATVTVVEADNEVKNAYVFDPKKSYKVKGRGGTAYQPAFDYFTNETDVDGVIYLGDMDCYDTEEIKKPKYPVLWAIIGNQKPPADFGSVTKIEITNKGS